MDGVIEVPKDQECPEGYELDSMGDGVKYCRKK